MQINGFDSITIDEMEDELAQGARFVMYSWCVSVLILSFKNPTDIYFIRSGESRVAKGLPFSLISLVAGWWGFPFGPIFTIWSLIENLGGGKDVTDQVLAAMREQAQREDDQRRAWQEYHGNRGDPYADD